MCLSGDLWTSFKESLKALERDIQHANALALEYPREHDCACFQMRLQRDFLANAFFFVPGADCSLVSSLGLLRILVFKVYNSGMTTKSTFETKASLREFYGFIYPSLLQLGDGIMNRKYLKQGPVGNRRTKDEVDDKVAHLDQFCYCSNQECDICMENNEMMVLPDCTHILCIKCFRDWNMKSNSCPFCRGSLKRTSSMDLWVISEDGDAKDMNILVRQDVQRLFQYIDNLPIATPEKALTNFEAHKNDNRLQLGTFPFGCHFFNSYGDEFKVYITTNYLERRLFYAFY